MAIESLRGLAIESSGECVVQLIDKMYKKLVPDLCEGTRKAFSLELCHDQGMANEAILFSSIDTLSGAHNHVSFGHNGMLAYLVVYFIDCTFSHSPIFIHFITLVNLCCTKEYVNVSRGRR